MTENELTAALTKRMKKQRDAYLASDEPTHGEVLAEEAQPSNGM